MRIGCRKILVIFAAAMMTAAAFISSIRPETAAAGPQAPALNAFFLNTVPTDYGKLELLFHGLKRGGANTIILKPVIEDGTINKNLLTNEVFLAHREGLKLFVVLPTRGTATMLAEHPDWEDLRYDLASGSIQPTGRLDLFHQPVVDALAALFRDVAGYSVDGILLAEDFYYGDTEGMSSRALEVYRQKYGSAFAARQAFEKIESDGKVQRIEALGDPFWNWTDLKKNALMNSFRSIVKAVWSVNPGVKMGIPLHVEELITPKEELAYFGHDMKKWSKMNIDYYWLAIPHRDIRTQRDLSYNKSMEVFSRMVKSAATIMKDPSKTIIAIQTTGNSGKMLPLTEIEEAVAMAKKAGEPGIAFLMPADTPFPAAISRKAFRR